MKRVCGLFFGVTLLGLSLVGSVLHAAELPLDAPMGEETARRLLARFGYGPTPADVSRTASLSVRQYLDAGIHGTSQLPQAVAARIASLDISQPVESLWQARGPGSEAQRRVRDDADGRKAFQREQSTYLKGAVQARLLAMANSPNQAHEVLLSFWLNHFSIFGGKGPDRLLAHDYSRAIEAAMRDDSFESLLRASFHHPAMQMFLDNAQSTAPSSMIGMRSAAFGRARGLNENLARELMELHTLGVDAGYAQSDVQALARIISGAGVWTPAVQRGRLAQGSVRSGLFLFDPRRHDFGAKHFLGQDFPAGHGIDEVERALHLLATSDATARHVSRRLAVRFVSDAPSSALVEAMARAFHASGGRISATLEAMVRSDEFRQSLAERRKFREPLDQLIAVSRAVCQSQPVVNGEALMRLAADFGEAPFMRSTPDGYAASESGWLSAAALAKRVRLASRLASGRPNLAAADDQRDAGARCTPDEASVVQLIGPLSGRTEAALRELRGPERIALLLASPEAMQR